MISRRKKNKQLLFLVALPRSGNTLFLPCANQNPEIAATPIYYFRDNERFIFVKRNRYSCKDYPDHRSLDNVMDSVYDNYYKDWPQRIIIDRGPVMTPSNFMLMQKHFKRPFKCIVLLTI